MYPTWYVLRYVFELLLLYNVLDMWIKVEKRHRWGRNVYFSSSNHVRLTNRKKTQRNRNWRQHIIRKREWEWCTRMLGWISIVIARMGCTITGRLGWALTVTVRLRCTIASQFWRLNTTSMSSTMLAFPDISRSPVNLTSIYMTLSTMNRQH